MAKLEIIGVPQSNYVWAMRMVCEEKGIAYELAPVPPHAPEVQAVHPFGKIPAMRHGDFALYESKAIATYLDRSFPGPQLIPADPRLNALTEQWVSVVNSVMDRTMIRTYLFAYVFPKTEDGKPDRKTIDEAVLALRQQVGVLDKAVAETGHLVGEQYTFADINLLPMLYYAGRFPEGAEAIGSARHLAAYYDRHAARPSFKNTTPPPPPGRQAKPN
jgi:glutathione S-transferase